jgi:hypothetical protein
MLSKKLYFYAFSNCFLLRFNSFLSEKPCSDIPELIDVNQLLSMFAAGYNNLNLLGEFYDSSYGCLICPDNYDYKSLLLISCSVMDDSSLLLLWC